MGDYIRGLVVRLHVTPEQDVLFKKIMVVLAKHIM